jgi:hypothetical protein
MPYGNKKNIELYRPARETPYRSPKAMSEGIQDILKDKIVCEFGCGEGDNMVFMSRYAKRVFGMELDPTRYKVAQEGGFEIIVGDYFKDTIPDAEVYYVWPNNAKDSPQLIDRILRLNPKFKGYIVVGGDVQVRRERRIIAKLAAKGELREISYNEGMGHRQSGTFLVAIIKVGQC